MEMDMKITVAGIGYVGLSNAILLSQHNEVYAYDINQSRIDKINQRISPFEDSYIRDYLEHQILNLTATTDAEEAFTGADYIIISTPTDYDPDKNYFNTSTVEAVMEQAIFFAPNASIVIKSTVPVGYTKGVKDKFPTQNIMFSPEFLREGHALYDNLYPSRIIVGVSEENELLKSKAEEFIGLLKQGASSDKIPIQITSLMEAEAIKLFANTYLALRVAFFNELDTYAETRGLNTKQIIDAVCLDPRIGNHYNNPSFGYGGYCLPKDTKQLLANYQDIPNNIIGSIVEANQTRKEFIAKNILEKNPKVVGIYRLTMKSDSDNFRQSSIIGIIQILKESGVELLIFEPTLKEEIFCGSKVIQDLNHFKALSDIIVANRNNKEIGDVADKVYTRDLYYRD